LYNYDELTSKELGEKLENSTYATSTQSLGGSYSYSNLQNSASSYAMSLGNSSYSHSGLPTNIDSSNSAPNDGNTNNACSTTNSTLQNSVNSYSLGSSFSRLSESSNSYAISACTRDAQGVRCGGKRNRRCSYANEESAQLASRADREVNVPAGYEHDAGDDGQHCSLSDEDDSDSADYSLDASSSEEQGEDTSGPLCFSYFVIFIIVLCCCVVLYFIVLYCIFYISHLVKWANKFHASFDLKRNEWMSANAIEAPKQSNVVENTPRRKVTSWKEICALVSDFSYIADAYGKIIIRYVLDWIPCSISNRLVNTFFKLRNLFRRKLLVACMVE
jgi:hypothetical protein